MPNELSAPRVRSLAAQLRISMRAADLGLSDWSPLDVLTEVAMGFDRRPRIVDPVTGLVTQEAQLLPVTSVELRMSAARELATYVAPKIKTVDLPGGEGEALEERKLGLVDRLLDALARSRSAGVIDLTQSPQEADHVTLPGQGAIESRSEG